MEGLRVVLRVIVFKDVILALKPTKIDPKPCGGDIPFQQLLRAKGDQLCRANFWQDCQNILIGAVDTKNQSSATGFYICNSES